MQRLRLLLPIIALVGLLSTTGCNEFGLCQRGTGERETRTLDLSAISGIDISGATEVFIREGETQQVQVESYPNVLDALDFTVSSGILHTNLEGCWNNTDLVVYLTITEPLSYIDVSGSGEVTSETTITAADELDIEISGSGDIILDVEAADIDTDISGSGKITLTGTAANQSIGVSGSGDYLAFDLIAQDCDVQVSGSGKVEVFVNGELDVRVSGSGDVFYKGDPASVDTQVSGSGRVEKVD